MYSYTMSMIRDAIILRMMTMLFCQNITFTMLRNTSHHKYLDVIIFRSREPERISEVFL